MATGNGRISGDANGVGGAQVGPGVAVSLRAVVAAISALLIGILGGSQIPSKTERLLVTALDVIEMKLRELSSGQHDYRPVEVEEARFAGLSGSQRERLRRISSMIAPQLVVSIHEDGVLRMERLVQKAGDDGENEFVEVRATQAVDLSRGRIGDQKRSPDSGRGLMLPSGLQLEKGESLRIFTTARFDAEPEADRQIELENDGGIWKGDRGEGDRVWIADRNGRVLLDLSYELR